MKNEIGGIWKKIKRSDFVAQRYRLSDHEFSTQNRLIKHEKAKADWQLRHDRVHGAYNHQKHPGKMPEFIPISEMNEDDKYADRTGSIYHINVENANCGAEFKPIKNGIIFWNQNINLTKYVDLYFQEDAIGTRCLLGSTGLH